MVYIILSIHYLNIGNQVMNDNINYMPSLSCDKSEGDTNIPKTIYCSEALVATEVLIFFSTAD